MAIRSQGHSTSPYDAVMRSTGRNTGIMDYDPPLPEGYGARGVIGGGQINYGGGVPYTNQMQYITIATTGNASDYGDLTVARYAMGATAGSESGRGVWGGGWLGSRSDVMDYKTIASSGNASDFGNLIQAKSGIANNSNGVRGTWQGGQNGPTYDVIGYITFSTTGNSTDFGDLTVARQGGGQMSSNTRGVHFGGGTQSSPYNTDVIDYITIANTGNATDFGDVAAGQSRDVQSCSNLTRGVCAVQYVGSSNASGLEYVTIASTGNASNFGSLSTGTYNQDGRRSVSGGSVEDRGLWYMGGPSSAWVKDIEYVTISTTGNSTDFGDTLYPGRQPQGCSGPSS